MTDKAVEMRDLTRLQNTSAWMVRGTVDVPVDTESSHCHSSRLGALCAVAEDEIRGQLIPQSPSAGAT